MEYRNKFNRDVWVDIVGYRLGGHNEQDLADFTQPVMYSIIKKKLPVYKKYS